MNSQLPILRRRHAGLTLIELLISIVIGLLVVGALLVVFFGARSAYRSGDSLARVQEAGRFAVEYVAQDARMAGYNGCRSRNLSSTFRYPTLVNITAQPTVAFNGADDAVIGFENGAGWTNATTIARVAGSDVLSFRRATGVPVAVSANSDPANRTVTLLRNTIPALRKGDIAVLANCDRAMLFRVTNDLDPAKDDEPTVLAYAAATGSEPANATGVSIPAFNLPVWDDTANVRLGTRAEVTRFVEASYFVGQVPVDCNDGDPDPSKRCRRALYRAAGAVAEELVSNVEDMDIVYGIDADEDGDVDGHWTAAQVAANGGWGRVVSARISLLVAGQENNVTTGAQSQTFVLRDTNNDGVPDAQAPAQSDGRLRHVFTTTVSLRNRTQ